MVGGPEGQGPRHAVYAKPARFDTGTALWPLIFQRDLPTAAARPLRSTVWLTRLCFPCGRFIAVHDDQAAQRHHLHPGPRRRRPRGLHRTATSTFFGIISCGFLGVTPPHAHRVLYLYSTWCPCAYWMLFGARNPMLLPNSRLQAAREKYDGFCGPWVEQ